MDRHCGSAVTCEECHFFFFSSTALRAELALLFSPKTQAHHELSSATQPAMATSSLMHSPMGMDMNRAALGHMWFPRSTLYLQGVRFPGLSLFWGFLLGCCGKGLRKPELLGLYHWVGSKGKVSMGIAGLDKEKDPAEGEQTGGAKC